LGLASAGDDRLFLSGPRERNKNTFLSSKIREKGKIRIRFRDWRSGPRRAFFKVAARRPGTATGHKNT
jgi:hypothetical protein